MMQNFHYIGAQNDIMQVYLLACLVVFCYFLTPKALFAESKVLDKSMAIVMGPTPPGTGVIAEAFKEASSKQTSPTSL